MLFLLGIINFNNEYNLAGGKGNETFSYILLLSFLKTSKKKKTSYANLLQKPID